MKNNILIIAIICWSSAPIKAQTKCDCFDRLYNLSVNYYLSKDWEKVISILKDAITFLDSDQVDDYYYELGGYYNRLNNNDSARYYFTKAIQSGYAASSIKRSYPAIFKTIDSNIILKYFISQKTKIDFSLYDKFVGALAVDQSVRDGTLFPEEDIFHGAPIKIAFIDTLSRRVDSVNSEFILWFLEKYQFPNEYKLGFYPSGFIALLLHITAYDNKGSRALFSKLEYLNKTCNFPQKSIVLYLKDRQKLYKENKSCCGLTGYDAIRYTSIENVNIADSIRFTYNQIRLKEELTQNDTASKNTLNELIRRGYKPVPYPNNYFCLKKYHFE